MDSNYSLSDIASVVGNEGFGGGMGGYGILLLFFLFAATGGGFGGFGARQQAATTDEVSAGFNFAGINNKLNELDAGQANINQNLSNAICSSTYELASKISDCCCQTQLGVQQVRYDMAVQHGDLKALIHSEGEATRAMIQQNKIESLQAQVNQLQLAQAMCGVPKISTNAWGVYPYNAYGAACGCGCGNI